MMHADPTYGEAADLIDAVAEVVRDRKRAADVTEADTRRAIARNAATQAELTEAVGVLRDLVAALSDGAGHSRRYDLAACCAAAWALVGRPVVDTLPL